VSYVTHANVDLTPKARGELARLVLEEGWMQRRAAERFQCSSATAKSTTDRYRTCGEAGMADVSSRPRRLACLDHGTGLPVRKPAPQRYEHENPGDLIHVDIKKLRRIPNGGGHRALGRAKGRRNKRTGTGYAYLHHAVDDHSRLAYSEILNDETKETAAAFWLHAAAFFAAHGIIVKAVLTDNGSCYRFRAFKAALGPHVKHRRTRPYPPQTNGKVERFNRTLATEWTYARPYASETERATTYQRWLHHDNHHRTHTGIGGKTPISRVHNVRGITPSARICRRYNPCYPQFLRRPFRIPAPFEC
jgi:transposase InsO family protein